MPTSNRRTPDRSDTTQEPLLQKRPYTTEHSKPLLAHSHTADEVPLDQNKTHDDNPSSKSYPGDVLGAEAAKAKAAKKSKIDDRKGKAVKPDPVVIEVPLPPMSPPMPPPPNSTSPPFPKPGQEPAIIDISELLRPKKAKLKKPQRSGFAEWDAHQIPKLPRHLPGSSSSYSKRVHSLMSCMPHLEALYSFKRDPETSPVITRLEYKNNIENPRRKSRRTFQNRDWLGPNSKNFAKKLSSGGTSSTFLRVLFVEGLTAALIDTLGILYGVDPELFASHMASSGSSNLSYGDPPPTRWSTAKMRKSYYSLKCYRPVQLEKRVSQWLRSPKDLAKLEEEGIEWSETTHERRGQDIYET